MEMKMECAVVADNVAAPLPGRCAYFVERKKRYCKMVVGGGKAYCGEHANADAGSDRKRISCPLDDKHTVYEDSLAKHLKKCNSKEKPKPLYYVKDINAGPDWDKNAVSDKVSLADYSREDMEQLLQKLKLAVKGLSLPHRESICTHPALHDALNDPKNGDFACKHLKQQASIVGNMASLDLLGSRRCVVEFGAGRGKLSHWIRTAQQEAQDVHFLLVERSTTRFKVDGKNKGRDCTFERMQVDIQHLDLSKVPLLQEKRLPVVGVGKHLCGSATVSLSLCLPPSLIPLSLPLPIIPLSLPLIPLFLPLSPSFHTDLALRCLLERSSWSEDKDEEDSKDDVDDELPLRKTERGEGQAVADGGVIGVQGSLWQPLVIGVSIALCCHHRCDWRHYVGQSFFQGQGLGAAEFQAFQRMSSWATCGMSRASHHHQGAAESRANHSHQGVTESSGGTERPHAPEEEEQEGESVPDSLSSMSVQERELIGRLCKRLIDEGRLCYLRGRGLEAELSCYTRTDISMENVLLTAVTRSGHTGATHAP